MGDIVNELAIKIRDYVSGFGLGAVWSDTVSEKQGRATETSRGTSNQRSGISESENEEKEKEKRIQKNRWSVEGGRWLGGGDDSGHGGGVGSDETDPESVDESGAMSGGSGGNSKVTKSDAGLQKGTDANKETQASGNQSGGGDVGTGTTKSKRRKRKLSRKERKLLKRAKFRKRRGRVAVSNPEPQPIALGGNDPA